LKILKSFFLTYLADEGQLFGAVDRSGPESESFQSDALKFRGVFYLEIANALVGDVARAGKRRRLGRVVQFLGAVPQRRNTRPVIKRFCEMSSFNKCIFSTLRPRYLFLNVFDDFPSNNRVF
jgi:hypothetical protein